MTLTDWAALSVAVCTIVGSFIGTIRWLVKHYLSELKPDGNGGHNLEGRISRLESRVEEIIDLLIGVKK